MNNSRQRRQLYAGIQAGKAGELLPLEDDTVVYWNGKTGGSLRIMRGGKMRIPDLSRPVIWMPGRRWKGIFCSKT